MSTGAIDAAETLTPRRRETRARLVDAALTTFAERGVAGSSVEQICDEAGFTRGAFYSNFDSKEDLCEAILVHVCGTLLDATRDSTVDAGLHGAQTHEEFIDRAISRFADLQPIDPRWPVVSTELRLHAIRNPEFRDTYAARTQQMHEELLAILAPAAAQQGLRLTLPLGRVMEILDAVQSTAMLQALVHGQEPAMTASTENLRAVLASFIAPDTSTDPRS